MRDDFQIPNLGQAPTVYDGSFFNRLVRNIETTFTAVRTIGRGIFSDLTTDTLTVNGDETITGNQTVTGNLAVTGTSTMAGVTATSISVSGTSTLHATTATTFAASGNTTVGGTLGVTGATTVTTLSASTSLAAPAYTRGGNPMTPAWETIAEGSLTGQTAFSQTNLSAYNMLKLNFYLVPVSVASLVLLRYSSNNGSSYLAGASDYSNYARYHSQTTPTTVSGGGPFAATQIDLSLSNTINPKSSGVFGLRVQNGIIDKWNKAGLHKCFSCDIQWQNTTPTVLMGNMNSWSGSANTAAAMNAFQITANGNAFDIEYLIEGHRG